MIRRNRPPFYTTPLAAGLALALVGVGRAFAAEAGDGSVSLSHKAYAFDWRSFEFDLHLLLEEALAADDPSAIEAFIDGNRESLTDPYEGDALPEDWRSGLENRDVHEYGDYALTRFYDPADDFGIAEKWGEVSKRLPEEAANALLGFTIGPPERPFDPGRSGSYFQTSAQVRESLAALKPLGVRELAAFVQLLERCAPEGRGVYVTF